MIRRTALVIAAVVVVCLPITAGKGKCSGMSEHVHIGNPNTVQIDNGYSHYKGTTGGNAVWGKKP